MLTLRRQVILRAESFIRTPFAHQGRCPGVGLDCIGVVDLSIRAVFPNFQSAPTNYEQISDGKWIIQELERRCDRVEFRDILPADILGFAFVNGYLQHLALAWGAGRMIHTWRGSRQCMKQDISRSWMNDLHSCWRVRGLN